MLNICTVCMSPGSHSALSLEHREILESLLSKTVNLVELRNVWLLLCRSCLNYLNFMVRFRERAITGVRHLLHLSSMKVMEEKLDEPEQLLMKEEPHNKDTNCEPAFVLEIEPEPFQVNKLQDGIKSEPQIKLEPDTEIWENVQESVPKSTIQVTNTKGGIMWENMQQSVPKSTVTDTKEGIVTLVTAAHSRQATSLLKSETTAVSTHSMTPSCVPMPTPTMNKAVTATPRPIRVVLDKLLKKNQYSPRFSNPHLPQFLPYYNNLNSKILREYHVVPPFGKLVPKFKDTNIPNSVAAPKQETKIEARSNITELSSQEVAIKPRWFTRVLPYRKMAMARVKERARPEFENAPYKCTSCILVFESQEKVDAHAKEHVIGPGQLPCKVCALPISPSEEAAHDSKHATRYQCARCGFNTERLQGIEKHDCSSVPMKRVYRIRKDKTIKCELCPIRFSDEAALERHKERLHFNPEESKCDICNRKFSSKKCLEVHMRMHKRVKEAKDKPGEARPELWCAECQIGFPTVTKYRAHRLSRKHFSKDNWKYECDICKRKSPNKAQLKMHIEIYHLMTRVSSCPECGKSIANPYVFRKHVRRHQLKRDRDRERPRPYVCELCGKAFMVKKNLSEHMFMHSGVRPFKCDLCPATFTYSAALFTHNKLKHLKVKCNEKKKRTEKETEKK